MSRKGKNKYSVSSFFGTYFENFGSVTLVNLFVMIPAAAFVGLMILAAGAGFLNLYTALLFIPLLSPFQAGLFYSARRLTIEESLSPARDFFRGIRECWKSFLVNGILMYIIILGLAITFEFYRGGFGSPVIALSFGLSVIFSFFFFSFENSMLTMFVTVDLGFGNITKNSVVLFFAGFWNHLKTLLVYMFIAMTGFSVFMLSGNTILVTVLFAAGGILMPLLCAYIVVFNTYQTVEKVVIVHYNKASSQLRRADERAREAEKEAADLDEAAALAEGDPEEFVFLGGRMVKRKSVIRLLEKMRQEQQE